MFGQIKRWQHPIHPQKTVSCQQQLIVRLHHPTLVNECGKRLTEHLENVHTELGFKVASVYASQFELQNEFPYHALFPIQEIPSIDRQLTVFQTFNKWLHRSQTLKVHAVYLCKR